MLTNEELKGKYIKYSPEITEEIFDKIVKKLESTDFKSYGYRCTFGGFEEYGNLEFNDGFYQTVIDSDFTEISYKDIIDEEKLQLKDLVEGEIYNVLYANTGREFINLSTGKSGIKYYINIANKSLEISGIVGSSCTIRFATPEEKQWLNVCIAENKFIEKDIALKNYDMNGKALKSKYIPEYVECINAGKSYTSHNNAESYGCTNYVKKSLVKGNIYKVIRYVEINSGSWGYSCEYDGKHYLIGKPGVKSSTKALYEAQLQQKEMKEVKFEVGKWYKNIHNGEYIAKLTSVPDKTTFPSKEYIYNGKYCNGGSYFSMSSCTEAIECPLEEIQQYLPEGHVDKIVKEWWKNLKKGDYVVLTDTYSGSSHAKNHIVKLFAVYPDENRFHSEQTGIGGWFYKSDIRPATPEEIKMYEHAGKPVDITKYKIPEVMKEEYKVGDWVTLLEEYGGLKNGTTYQVVKYQNEFCVVVKHDGNNSYLAPFCNKIRKATPEEIAKVTGKTEYFNDLSQYVGRYIKALVDYPNGGSVKKGEIGKILDSRYINFPSGENYAHSAALMESNKHKYKLLPESYLPEVNADSKEFVLPKKWYIKVTEENIKTLGKWRPSGSISKVYGYCSSIPLGFWSLEQPDSEEITLDQFKKYVLKEEPIKTGRGILDAVEPKKDNMEELLEEAKKRFPIGCTYITVNEYGDSTGDEIKVEDKSYIPYKYMGKNQIALKDGCGLVYANGKWAEVISSLEESVKKLPTDEELLEYANKHYVVGTKFISSIASSDNGKERECKYYDSKSSSFGWKVKNLESKGRVVRCDDGMYTKATNGSSVCSNPYIYSDKNGWCEITYSTEEKKTNHQFKVGDEAFLPEYGLGKFDDGSVETRDWALMDKIPLNAKLIVSRVNKSTTISFDGYLYSHAASKFKPISELNKKVKYNPVEWGWEFVNPYEQIADKFTVGVDTIERPKDWTVKLKGSMHDLIYGTGDPILQSKDLADLYRMDNTLTPTGIKQQDVISPILFNVKEI